MASYKRKTNNLNHEKERGKGMIEEMLEFFGYTDYNEILYEMFGVENDEDLEYAIDCYNND